MRGKLSGLVSMVALALACGGSDPADPGPEPQLPNGVFAAIVDGAEYAPTVATVLVSATHLTVVTSGDGLAFTFTLEGILPGTYVIGPSTPHLAAFTGPGTMSWLAQQSMGSGTINISINTGERLAGSFSLVLAPVPGTGAVGDKTVASGIINLTY